MAPRLIAVMNQKGGVGKTTLTVNLGAALGRMGKEVLLLDLDPQANLSIHLNVDIHNLACSVYDVLVGEEPLERAVLYHLRPGLSLVPANIDLSGAEVELVNAVGRETLLRDALKPYIEEHSFDFVFFDCPPSLGILSLNALAAAREVFIPIQTEFFALQGLAKLLGVIDLIARRLNPSLHLSRVIPTMYDTRTSLSKEVLEDIKNHFGDAVTRTVIRKNVRLAEAPSHGRTIFEYAHAAPGARDFDMLAREILGEAVEEQPPAPARRNERRSQTARQAKPQDRGRERTAGPVEVRSTTGRFALLHRHKKRLYPLSRNGVGFGRSVGRRRKRTKRLLHRKRGRRRAVPAVSYA